LEGIKYFFNTVSDEISGLGPNVVTALTMDTDAENLRSSIEGFYTNFKDQEVISSDGSGNVKPDSIQNLQPNITTYVNLETYALTEAAIQFHIGAESANKVVAGGAIVTYKLAVTLFNAKLDEFIVNMTRFETKVNDAVQYESRKTMINLVLWVILLGTLGAIIVYLSFLSCSSNTSCAKTGKCVNTTLSILKAVCSLFISTIGIICFIAAVIGVNSCYFMKKAMDDRQWTADIIKDDDMMVYMDLCFFKTSSGNLSELMPITHKSEFQDLTNLPTVKIYQTGRATKSPTSPNHQTVTQKSK